MKKRLFIGWLLSLLCTTVGCFDSKKPATSADGRSATQPLGEVDIQIAKTNAVEDRILKLNQRLEPIKNYLLGRSNKLSSVFDQKIQLRGLKSRALADMVASSDLADGSLCGHANWPIAEEFQSTTPQTIWSQILNQNPFEDVQIGILSGEECESNDSDSSPNFVLSTIFEGRLRIGERLVGIKAKQKMEWSDQFPDRRWRIVKWDQKTFHVVHSNFSLFEDVTESVILDSLTLRTAQHSIHDSMLRGQAKDPNYLKSFPSIIQYFTDWQAISKYTAASVVDFDNDGWDDLFLVGRHEPSMLLRNNGQGKFEDVSKQWGLRIEESLSNCALFADFDNDGDQDLFLGRTLQASQFYRNTGKKFRLDKSASKYLDTIRFVSAGSLADVNGDGLLDIYVSTYGTRAGDDFRWIPFVVPTYQQQKLLSLIQSSLSFLDRRGPPNHLLINVNGVLKPVVIEENVQQWRNSFQPIWLDYDDDGDADLYVSNDFAPDALLRNDTDRLSYQPKFTEVTQDVFHGNSMGYGMGAGTGDFDSDGDLDIYVSNMYSKAGQRIVKMMDGDVDPRINVSTKGNFLYEKLENGGFRNVAGTKPDEKQVSKVGWSFGGQMADFNNDGRLDIYVPSGFFTPPKDIRGDVDL